MLWFANGGCGGGAEQIMTFDEWIGEKMEILPY